MIHERLSLQNTLVCSELNDEKWERELGQGINFHFRFFFFKFNGICHQDFYGIKCDMSGWEDLPEIHDVRDKSCEF